MLFSIMIAATEVPQVRAIWAMVSPLFTRTCFGRGPGFGAGGAGAWARAVSGRAGAAVAGAGVGAAAGAPCGGVAGTAAGAGADDRAGAVAAADDGLGVGAGDRAGAVAAADDELGTGAGAAFDGRAELEADEAPGVSREPAGAALEAAGGLTGEAAFGCDRAAVLGGAVTGAADAAVCCDLDGGVAGAFSRAPAVACVAPLFGFSAATRALSSVSVDASLNPSRCSGPSDDIMPPGWKVSAMRCWPEPVPLTR